ncbi:MAG: hypothetical protein M5U15_04155 [Kiritimatiellae bacterium]|nr:hypothetical protein [Kiritimatiellia bacterium]
MKRFFTIGSCLVAVAVLSGCGTVREVYKPTQLGNLADNRNDSDIEITLRPDKAHARIGDPITFTVSIRNVGTQPILMPSDPDLLMMWIYPDGKRDNLIRNERKNKTEWLVLKPGEERIAHSVITTYYFDRSGIHEFRAVLNGANEIAMSSTRPTWHGRAVSNGFGVLFEGN